MTRVGRTFTLLGFVLFMGQGCDLAALVPWFEPDKVVFDPYFLGEWVVDDESWSMKLTQEKVDLRGTQVDGYGVEFINDKSAPKNLVAVLGKFGGELYGMAYLRSVPKGGGDWLTRRAFLLVWVRKTDDGFGYAFLIRDQVLEAIKAGKLNLKLLCQKSWSLSPMSVDEVEKDCGGGQLVEVYGRTAELRAVIEKSLKEADVFSDFMIHKRKNQSNSSKTGGASR